MSVLPPVLVVDDEKNMRLSLQTVLKDEGYAARAVESAEEALELLAREEFFMVITDARLGGMSGYEFLGKIRSRWPDLPAIMLTAYATPKLAVEAIQSGAMDYLAKPFAPEELLHAVARCAERFRLLRENAALRSRASESVGLDQIVGESQKIRELRKLIQTVAPTDARVLILGESGTGKELVAGALHSLSQRREAHYVRINCAAIPEDLIESELFGHYKGSFPGAAVDKEGKFQKASGGTLFLDEVGDMSLKTQSKVLRTLEEQRVVPLGGDETIMVDARIIASTNKDLEEEIAKGNFREDLFYRLNVIPFFVPPLRDRKEDIPLFARHFLKELAATYGRRPREITDDAVEVLMRYSWPGNVRELRNVIERIVIMNPMTTRFDRKHLPPLVHRDGHRRAVRNEFSTLHQARDAYERDFILKKLDENHGNVTRAAEVLGLERSHLYRKMKTLGIAAKE